MYNPVADFIRESNAIEDVWDQRSYEEALHAWHWLVGQDRVNHRSIQGCHLALMKTKLREAGCYRNQQVFIGRHVPPAPELVAPLMEDWIDKWAYASTEENIKQAHIDFEKIHPFIDGNGRVGRMILNYQRLASNLPILVIREKNKHEYYKWFE